MLEPFVFVLALAAFFSYINYRFLKLPNTIGLMILALVFAAGMAVLELFDPVLFHRTCEIVRDIDFRTVLMDVMLSLLLFAGAGEVKLKDLSQEKFSVLILATVGVLISTLVVGVICYYLFAAFSLNISFLYCLVFGALISPTDPVAVLAILKNSRISKALETKIAGESLFNDGIGVVVFITLLNLAQTGGADFSLGEVVWLLSLEVGGGVAFGIALGQLGYLLLRSISEEPRIQILLSISMVTGGYALASALHLSGPLAMVITGLIIANRGEHHFEPGSRKAMEIFWSVMDEILNAVLFVLIGLEILIIPVPMGNLIIAALVVWVVVVFGRFVAVSASYESVKRSLDLSVLKSILVLTWGGLRGGISIALALSLPESETGYTLIFLTYSVVVLSILLQGLSIGKLVQKLNLVSE